MTDYYVTFGPASVMRAKKIVMIVSGVKKAEILKKILEGLFVKKCQVQFYDCILTLPLLRMRNRQVYWKNNTFLHFSRY